MGYELARLSALIGLVLAALLGAVAVASPAMSPGHLPIQVGAHVGRESVVVVQGDNLWSISEGHLVVAFDRAVDDEEVSPYWRRVITANSGDLRSGDPDLIYPGEVVLLPATDD